jgi:translocation and assembly module TamB
MTCRNKRLISALALLAVLFSGGAWALFNKARLAGKVKSYLVARIDQATGGRTTIGDLQLELFPFLITLRDFQLRGRKPDVDPAFLQIKEVRLKPRLRSLFSNPRLKSVELVQPIVNIRIRPDGAGNFPHPGVQLEELDLFNVGIDRLIVTGGIFSVEDRRFNLDAEFAAFRLLVRYASSRRAYHTEMSYGEGLLHYGPWRGQHRLALSATVLRNEIQIERISVSMNRSDFEATGVLRNLKALDGRIAFKGVAALDAIRDFYPEVRNLKGGIGISGSVAIDRGVWKVSGQLEGKGLSLDTARIDKATARFLVVPDRLRFEEVQVAGLGGSAAGSLEVSSLFHNPVVKAQLAFRHIGLPELALVARLEKIRFAAFLDGTLVASWQSKWKDFTGNGQFRISKAEGTGGESAGTKALPLEGQLNFAVARWSSSFQDSYLQLGSTRLAFSGLLSPNHTSNLHFEFHSQDLSELAAYFPALAELQGSASFVGSAAGTLKQPEFQGQLTANNLAYRTLSVDHLDGQIRANSHQLELLQLAAREKHTVLQARGRILLDPVRFVPVGAEGLWLKVKDAAAQDLFGVVGRSFPAEGSVTGEATLDGLYPDLRLQGKATIYKGSVYDQSFDKAELEFLYRPSRIEASRLKIEIGQGRVEGSGWVDLGEQALRASLSGTEIALAQLRGIEPRANRVSGTLTKIEFIAEGPIRSPNVEGRVTVKGLSLAGESLGDFSAEFHRRDQSVEFTAFSLKPDSRLQAKGFLGWNSEWPINAEIQFREFSFTPYVRKLLPAASETLASQGSGTLTVSGPLRFPERISLAGSFSALKLAFQDTQIQASQPFSLSYRDQRLAIQNAAFAGKGTALRVNGSIDLSKNMKLEADLTGTIDLALVSEFTKKVVAKGTATLNASIRGTLADPQMKGYAEIRAEQFGYEGFPNSLSQASGRFFFDENQVNIADLTGVSGGGKVRVNGNVVVGQAQVKSINLNLEAREVRLRYPEGMRNVVDADLVLRGSRQSQSLGGTLRIQNASFQKDYDPIFEFLRNRNAQIAIPAGKDLGEHLNLDLLITADRNIHVDTRLLKLESGANLQVKGTLANPSVTGSLEATGGELYFQGSRYRITRGRVDFINPVRLEPVIDLEAETDVRDYRVILTVKGTADKLHADLRSDPPLSTVELFSLVSSGGAGSQTFPGAVFTPYSATGRQLDTPTAASSLLSEGLSMKMGSPVKRIFGLDQFLIEPRSFLYGGPRDPSARVTVGQQITKDFSATYSTSVSSSEQQVIILIYNLNNSTSIIASRDADGYFGLDVRFRKRLRPKNR